jgi:dipeptidyl-peptidase-4
VLTDENGEKSRVLLADGKPGAEIRDLSEPQAPVNLEVVKVGPGDGLWTAIVRPKDFDRTKKYPVLVQVYAGPHGAMVARTPRKYQKEQSFADHGYIVVMIDGRGTPGRGRAFERAIAGKFHEVPLEDQVTGLQALGAHEPAMDLSRVGIYGGSFGGYMAALAVLRRPDVFHAAVASAPVADWLDYDTAYTERYLGVPDLGGDTAVYEANGLPLYARELSRPLLIVHGTADDNVHFSNALELADALLRNGQPYELVTLGKQTHATRDPGLIGAMSRKTLDFFAEALD